ncbi:MAG: hypothetical protein EBU93_00075 [Chlamydiae bacterium]|nr:hypothetical protein [Chlamydiota bacterium]
MKNPVIALFGESQKGSYNTLIHIRSLIELSDHFGEPIGDSSAINLAIQALHFQKELIFMRVKEEGYSFSDYLKGIELLEKATIKINLVAICLPGVGHGEIIEETFKLCEKRGSLFIASPQDLYDYLTDRPYKIY